MNSNKRVDIETQKFFQKKENNEKKLQDNLKQVEKEELKYVKENNIHKPENLHYFELSNLSNQGKISVELFNQDYQHKFLRYKNKKDEDIKKLQDRELKGLFQPKIDTKSKKMAEARKERFKNGQISPAKETKEPLADVVGDTVTAAVKPKNDEWKNTKSL